MKIWKTANYCIYTTLIFLMLSACKAPLEEVGSELRTEEIKTHLLDINYEPSTQIASHRLTEVSTGAEVFVKEFNVTQIKSGEFKLPSIATEGYVAIGGLPQAPMYAVEIILANDKTCHNIEPVYLSIKGAPIHCKGTTVSSSPASKPDAKGVDDSSDVVSGSEDPLSSAPECVEELRREYLICRLYDGGKRGCYDKFACIVTLTSEQCEVEKNDIQNYLSEPYESTDWLCASNP